MNDIIKLHKFLILLISMLLISTLAGYCQNGSLDKTTGYKNFKFGLSKSALNKYDLKAHKGYVDYVYEPGIDQFIITKYNEELADFKITSIILFFSSDQLVKISLQVDGNGKAIQDFLEYTFGKPTKKSGFPKTGEMALYSLVGETSEWKGNKVYLTHSKNIRNTVPSSYSHKITFRLADYESIKSESKETAYKNAALDFFDASTDHIPTKNVVNPVSKEFQIGDKIYEIPNNLELLGIASSDNSKIYRYTDDFPTTTFGYQVDKYETKIWNNTVVSFHFVLFPGQNNISANVPQKLLRDIESKSGTHYYLKETKYYFDESDTRTVVYRANTELYGDRIHILVVSKSYLYK